MKNYLRKIKWLSLGQSHYLKKMQNGPVTQILFIGVITIGAHCASIGFISISHDSAPVSASLPRTR